MTESSIQSLIRMALSPHGMVFRTNSGDFWQGEKIYLPAFKQDILINLRRVQGLPKGFPDLIYYGFDGQAGFIEVKKLGENPKPEQQKFIKLMQSYDYCAGIARSAEDALKIIQL
jgi:hypothetical protein